MGRRAAEEDLGWEELFAGQGVSLVEWAEQAPELWPEERLEVRLERPLTGPATRRPCRRVRGLGKRPLPFLHCCPWVPLLWSPGDPSNGRLPLAQPSWVSASLMLMAAALAPSLWLQVRLSGERPR